MGYKLTGLANEYVKISVLASRSAVLAIYAENVGAVSFGYVVANGLGTVNRLFASTYGITAKRVKTSTGYDFYIRSTAQIATWWSGRTIEKATPPDDAVLVTIS